MQSVVTFEKPLPHLSLPDWDARLYNLQVTADTRRADAFDLRHSAHQLRNETRIKTEWDTYHNNNRISARIYEIEQWKSTIQDLLNRINREMDLLKEEKASTERELEQLNLPLLVCSECLSNRDGRRSTELTYDMADTELKKELCVTESNKKLLIDRCQSAWEKINKLEVMKFKLQLDLNDKNEALAIDKDMLSLDKNCANITFKTDSLKTPKRMITGQQWVDKVEGMKRMAEDELRDTLRLRESLFVARGRARNALRAQTDVTNYMLRRRIYDTQRARNELEWQKIKMEENMDKLKAELKIMGEQFTDKVDALKVAETRLETRGYRPGIELASDEADVGLKEEVRNLRETVRQLQEKLDCAKATYNALESASIKIGIDLNDKNQSLEVDTRALEMRSALEPKQLVGTDKNLVLANIQDELPKMENF
ncbi:tektin-B1-like [Pectinophora gossypiella]|uniref:tektin-B1-like n=1 Tax=Pectinophora gossypiella TaxID=13191 RepID=UPI00214F3C5F|nr:tektin-B1-like [Pectinophora gossypiella]